ncbi:hypothetical protein Btru_018692 [Bulinus truncatus]|nr:hypothetical protein Btru_018692 [Bulinus truncatus]
MLSNGPVSLGHAGGGKTFQICPVVAHGIHGPGSLQSPSGAHARSTSYAVDQFVGTALCSPDRMSSAFRYVRKYTGPVRACIMDWSGTTIDKYVLAPALVFVEVFKKNGVHITMAEARAPMGVRKDVHVKTIMEMPEVRMKWKSVHGEFPTPKDAQRLYEDLVPMQLGVLLKYTDLIPECVDAMNTLRKDFGCKIGVTTGFTRSMVDVLLPEAKRQGFVPDANIAGDDVINGSRPKPFMLYANLDRLNVPEIHSVVKVDDTTTGVAEALSAGCWGVGVARYSNYMDINSLEEEAALTESDIEGRLQRTRGLLTQAGAHYVIDTLAELPSVVADINARLSRGESP